MLYATMFRRWATLCAGLLLTGFFGVGARAAWVAQRPFTTASLNGVAFGGGGYVAVEGYSGSGGVWISPDGVSWTVRSAGITDGLFGVSHGGGRFVAVGGDQGGGGVIVTSTDGQTWTSQYTANCLYGVYYVEGQFVAVGEAGRLSVSTDGTHWTDGSSRTTVWLKAVAGGNGTRVAVGGGGTILASANGVDWLPQTTGLTHDLKGVAFGNGTFVAVGNLGPIVTSTDGHQWTRQSVGGAFDLKYVGFAQGEFIAVGNYGVILTSTNGQTWAQPSAGATACLYGVSAGLTNRVVVGAEGTVLTAPFQGADPGNAGPYVLTVTTTGGGTVRREPELPAYASGTAVKLSAIPDAGRVFTGWQGDIESRENPVTVVMSGPKTITAAFAGPAGTGGILFTSDRDGDDEIYVMNPDGTGVRQLTANTLKDGGARWSADGTQIYFLRNDAQIWVMDQDGTRERLITEGNSLAVSPDGKTLALTKYGGGVYASDNLFLYTLATGNTTGIASEVGNEQCPDFSPDGSQIVYVNNFLGYGISLPYRNLCVVGANGGGRRQLTSYDEWGRAFPDAPRWSPDGKTIVFANNGPSQNPLLQTIKPDGSAQAGFINSSLGGTGSPVWSPDSAYVVVSLNGRVLMAEYPFIKYAVWLTETGHHDLPTDWRGASPAPRTYSLTITPEGTGTVTRDPNKDRYDQGDLVTLTAAPGEGYVFEGWSGDLSGSQNPTQLAINTDKTVTARFVKPLASVLDGAGWVWITGGDASWFGQTAVTHDGVGAAQSGAVKGNLDRMLDASASWLETTVTGPGRLDFWWKFTNVAFCELRFAIDGAAKEEIVSPQVVDWTQKTFALGPGSHTLRWTYQNGDTRYPVGSVYVDQVLFTSASGPQTVLYVKADAAGANNGRSWPDAYRNLKDALAAAQAGQSVWVAAGTYPPGNNRSDSFQLRTGVPLYGGFSGGETNLNQRHPALHASILSGEIGDPANREDNVYHVVIGAASTRLDGFTVTRAFAGAGLQADEGSPQHLAGGMDARFDNVTVENCQFVDNAAERGGGLCAGPGTRVVNCRFLRNKALYNGSGGAVLAAGGTFINCAFVENVAGFPGAAWESHGAGLFSLNAGTRIINCSFRGNRNPGQIMGDGGGAAPVGSEEVWQSCPSVDPVDGPAQVVNSILAEPLLFHYWGPGNPPAGLVITFSCLPHEYPGEGNLVALDPRLDGDLHPLAGSPCRDAGSNAAVPPDIATDLAGLPRVVNQRVDMGAYEFVEIPDPSRDAPRITGVTALPAGSLRLVVSGSPADGAPAFQLETAALLPGLWTRVDDAGYVRTPTGCSFTLTPTAGSRVGFYRVVRP